MSVRGKIIRLFFEPRRAQLRRALADPLTTQRDQLRWLLERGSHTEIGRRYDMSSIKSLEQFEARVDTFDYDAYSPYIDRARRGERDVVWNGEVRWFARSSGTTDRSKYIPVTQDGLHRSHTRGTRDVAAIASALFPDTRAYDGKLLTLGGSRRVEREGERALTGDLSAILIENTKNVSGWFRTPTRDIALIADFDEKIEAICRQTTKQNVTSFAGVPSWNLMLMRRILEYTGKQSICEVWPNLELFVHGGVGFAPYAEHYKRIIPSERMRYMNTYNASEGFFAMADASEQEDMLLMVDYGTFYEFDNGHEIVPLEGVRVGEDYEMII
ncbi:MAG: GH3 auxin-responsive promoter family protein, partial [Rikenellaceae bacterium]|nr:GH3 auxin-responsive promoter family protein [Rikenellaceae bacterium]